MFNSIVMLDASVRGLLLALLWLDCYCFLAEGGCWWLGFMLACGCVCVDFVGCCVPVEFSVCFAYVLGCL